MDIQDLTYDNLYRKPAVIPERISPLLLQESSVFQPVESAVEIEISEQIGEESNSENDPNLADFLPFGLEANTNGALPLKDVYKIFEEKSAELSGRLRQFFSSHGIQAPIAADLAVDSEGRVIVSNAGSDKAALEAEFAKDAELQKDFLDLSASAPLLRAADTSQDFAAAYELNPKAAQHDYAHLFSDTFKFTYHFENNQLSGEFKTDSGQSIQWWHES